MTDSKTPSRLVVLGVSHHTAPLELREKLSVKEEMLGAELTRLTHASSLTEAVLLSTCNRIELYAVSTNPVHLKENIERYFVQTAGPMDLRNISYLKEDEAAVRHAFRVASSLDSMVLGEAQVLGQMKRAFATAQTIGTVGTLLSRWFHHAFGVAKRVRSETGLAKGTVSVSSVAVELAEKIFGSLKRRHVLLLGAGKMSLVAGKSLAKQGARISVINRTSERAGSVAEALGARTRPFEELDQELIDSDVVIVSTASDTPILTAERMGNIVTARKHRPLFLIDISVPRNVEASVSRLDNTFLYDIDDLKEVTRRNLEIRQAEASTAEHIVENEVTRFESWRRSLALTPTIIALREKYTATVQKELEKTLPRLALNPEQRAALDSMCDRIVQKLLHQPLTELKRGVEGPEALTTMEVARRLFDLGDHESHPDDARRSEPETVTHEKKRRVS